jgi:hypothetical protein
MKHLTKSRRVATVAVASGAAIAMASGVAYAVWSSTGAGTGAAKSGTITFVVNASAPTFGGTGTTVHPGSVAGGTGDSAGGSLFVSINNTSGFALKATQVQQTGGVTVTTPSGTCASDTGSLPSLSSNSAAFVGTQAPASYGATTTGNISAYQLLSAVTIPTGTNTIELPNVVGMGTASLTGCQGGSLSIPVTITATS